MLRIPGFQQALAELKEQVAAMLRNKEITPKIANFFNEHLGEMLRITTQIMQKKSVTYAQASVADSSPVATSAQPTRAVAAAFAQGSEAHQKILRYLGAHWPANLEQVIQGTDTPRDQAAALLRELHSKRLVTAVGTTDGVRYQLHSISHPNRT